MARKPPKKKTPIKVGMNKAGQIFYSGRDKKGRKAHVYLKKDGGFVVKVIKGKKRKRRK